MLRVRPIHYTSRMDEWERLLTAVGLVKTVDDATWREFDAGSGRLALHFAEAGSAEDGSTDFGVEVGDLAEFARRTAESAGTAGAPDGSGQGTRAEVLDAEHGSTCKVTAADGFSFLADPAVRAADGGWGGVPDADPDLAVVGLWFAADPATAARTLRDIGARPRPVPGTGAATGSAEEAESFTAKNGGILMIGTGAPGARQAAAGLAFEYAGDLGELRRRLEDAGEDAALVEQSPVPLLHLANPDAEAGATHAHPLWISRAPAAD